MLPLATYSISSPVRDFCSQRGRHKKTEVGVDYIAGAQRKQRTLFVGADQH
jgi:hypothetical protein